MPNDKCPVCGVPWKPMHNTSSVAADVAHLVQDHAWLLEHALAWVKNPDLRLSDAEVIAEVARLRQQVRMANKRIKWLVTQNGAGHGSAERKESGTCDDAGTEGTGTKGKGRT